MPPGSPCATQREWSPNAKWPGDIVTLRKATPPRRSAAGSLGWRPLVSERGLVALVDEEATGDLTAAEERPAAARNWLTVVGSLPRELDRGLATALPDPIVDVRFDRDEREFAAAACAERDVSGDELVQIGDTARTV